VPQRRCGAVHCFKDVVLRIDLIDDVVEDVSCPSRIWGVVARQRVDGIGVTNLADECVVACPQPRSSPFTFDGAARLEAAYV
jgi:hypothetical protein